MAKPIPPLVAPRPVPAGDPAGVCWGPGKPFGDLETPESVVIVFSGILKGPNWYVGAGDPPNGTYELPQDPGTSQIFELIDVMSIFVGFGLFQTDVRGKVVATDDDFFDASIIDQCVIKFSNDEDDIFTAGTAYIYIPKALL